MNMTIATSYKRLKYTDGLIHAYSFDELIDNAYFYDKIGTATLLFTGGSTGIVLGKVNNAVDFNGESLIGISDNPLNLDVNYNTTLKFWVYIDDTTNAKTILKGSYTSDWLGLSILHENDTLFLVYGGGSDFKMFESVSGLNIGWNYVVISLVSFSEIALMINNDMVTTIYTSGSLTAGNMNFDDATYIFFCDYDTTTYYTGKLDELYIWNRNLTLAEMQNIYTIENTGTSIL